MCFDTASGGDLELLRYVHSHVIVGEFESAEPETAGVDEGAWPGEVKIAGRAIPDGAITGEGALSGEMFVADITEVVFVHLDSAATKLIVEWWTPNGGRREAERT